MSKYDLELKERSERIEVKEIIERIPKDSTGLPGMRVRDFNNREHHLTAVDFPSFEWDRIREGTILIIELKEEIQSVRVLRFVIQGRGLFLRTKDDIDVANEKGDNLVGRLLVEFISLFDVSIDKSNIQRIMKRRDAYRFVIWYPPEKEEVIMEAAIRNASELGMKIGI